MLQANMITFVSYIAYMAERKSVIYDIIKNA